MTATLGRARGSRAVRTSEIYFQRKCTKTRPKLVGVLLDAVVQRLDLLLVEKAQHVLLELRRNPFPG